MDLRKLKTLVDLVSESNISELEITEAEGKVRIVKQAPATAVPVQYLSAAAAPMVAAAPAAAPEEPAAPSRTKVVKSPMVGTFYRASAPGAKPFVEVGDTIKLGQPVCIVEAMKILNEIEAEVDGVVKSVLVENGQPVEYGQPLFELE